MRGLAQGQRALRSDGIRSERPAEPASLKAHLSLRLSLMQQTDKQSILFRHLRGTPLLSLRHNICAETAGV